ncbi:exonuclease V [Russula earlei]|uniref:Exonuclease V n=1 Tax=Russula earlei TaxID=71964 RepID=A0ACC0UB93_9AGAM|nr:exonuclease V [Russula earlei]
MVDSWDEFDAYDLSEFSSADFVHIDATTHERDHHQRATRQVAVDVSNSGAAERRVGTSGPGGPRIAVALEPTADESVLVKVAEGGSGSGDDTVVVAEAQNVDDRGQGERSDSSNSDSRSPFEKHRLRGTLSVSDLVGPAWCVLVQFDYRLRQGRSLPLADRPDSFVSAEGKIIKAQKEVAKINEEVLERGRAVHKKLESQINPIEIAVDIQSEEEYWAARLINMLACLGQLMQLDFCREMPVFGIVQDQPIIGVIDEVWLKSIPEPEPEPSSQNKRASAAVPGTPRKSKKQRESSSQSQVTDFFASPPKAKTRRSASPLLPMINELSLIDTKTRRSNSLPSDDDARPSCLQLMLYYHLLSALISPTFSFSTFWEKVHIDPLAPLSDTFLLQSGLLQGSDGNVVFGYPTCLDDLVDIWQSTVHSLHLRGVSPTLEIVYRTQPKRRARQEAPRPGLSDDFAAAHRQALDTARAIAASLQEQPHDPDLQRAIAESLRDLTHNDRSGVALANDGNPRSSNVAEQLSDTSHIPWYALSGVMESAQPETVEWAGTQHIDVWTTAETGSSGTLAALPRPGTARVIGRKSFAFDEVSMQGYVQDVLQWWRGERPPRGVDIEHSRRCFSCEYREDCEWREKKAKEAQERYAEGRDRRSEGAGRFDKS